MRTRAERRSGRFTRMLLAAVILLTVLLHSTVSPVPAFGGNAAPGTGVPGLDGTSSTLTERAVDPATGQPISELSFSLYKVADMHSSKNAGVQFTVTPEFREYDGKTGCSMDFREWQDQSKWAEGAKNLAPLVIADEYAGKTFVKYTAKTGADGIARWTDIPQGLYLLIARYEGDAYSNVETQPVLLTLPKLTGDEITIESIDPEKNYYWQHEVNADAKTVTIKSAELVSLKVRKIWSGDDTKEKRTNRPASVEVTLHNTNGETVDKVKLKAANNWQHTWTDLDGKESWTVIETIKSDHYTPTYTQEKSADGKLTTWTVKNVFKEVKGANRDKNGRETDTTPPDERLPQTGQQWWPIWILGGAAIALVIAGITCRKSGRT